jgi:quercetin dioxygenase-like cupin family protein
MTVIDPRQAATDAVSRDPRRPATAIVYDSPDARAIVFRLAGGQQVPPHRSLSTVILTVMSGRGIVSGDDGEKEVQAGEVIVYQPNELHGMRSGDESFVLLATITPGPGVHPPLGVA